MRTYLVFCMCTLICLPIFAQDFVNGDLEGTIDGTSSIPPGWSAVGYADPICTASATFQATPDMTSLELPSPSGGISGQPYSGEVFVSGLDGGNAILPDKYWHEGIQQEVSGFTPNEDYIISFFQAVVKQSNGESNQFAIDTSGSWAVYLDDDLIGTSSPSVSLMAYDSPDLPWAYRQIVFTASQQTHIIKFLPTDDDSIFMSNDENGAVRMGIDDIQLGLTSAILEMPDHLSVNVYPNPSFGCLHIELDKSYQEVQIEIFNLEGQLEYYNNFNNANQLFLEFDFPKGMYLLHIVADGNFDFIERVWVE